MEIGGKAKNLTILAGAGFRVPRFISHFSTSAQLTSILDSDFRGIMYFAVRSSAFGEDSANKSFAGQFYSAIGVTRAHVQREIEKVIMSYKGREGSVIIQEFVPSETSGVLFTEVASNKIIINSTLGLCSTVVNGEACDEYITDKTGLIITKKICDKNALFFQDGLHVRRMSSEESLSAAQIKQLAQTAAKIQKLFGTPQDVEWAYKGGELYILQSRPITTAPKIAEIEYFDSANIAESYSGIVLPLTFSFAEMVYSCVYKDLLNKSGVSQKKIAKHSKTFDNLLGYFNGRMYYNMNNWYRMAEFVPGYRRNKQNFESMITSNIRAEIGKITHPSYALKILYPILIVVKVLKFGITTRRFKMRVTKELYELRRKDFNNLTYEECLRVFDEINNQLLRKWYITVENDFFVMTYLGILTTILTKSEIQRVLTFASKATEQVDALASLSQKMNRVDTLWNAIEDGDIKIFEFEILKQPEIKHELETYMQTFGGRFANELKLESRGIDEDGFKLLSVLKLYQVYGTRDTVAKKPVISPHPLSIGKKFFLKKFKKYASQREEFRLLRSNTFAMARKLFRRIGNIFVMENLINSADDIFYLKLEEILQKKYYDREYKNLVENRKREYISYTHISPPAHFATSHNVAPSTIVSTLGSKTTLVGQSASPGKITGRIKVFHEFFIPPHIDFDILVTSHTDPGWTSLIALSKGLIIEHGGILSHASIVARELGIPTIIGVENATKFLKDGDLVELDATSGEIKILKHENR
jgi:phosphohistidine swiveling domain-containing protein